MKKLLVAAAVAGLVGTANAQSAFEGFYGQIATGYESNSISSLGGNATVTPVIPGAFATTNPTVSNGNQNASGMPLIIGLGYNFKLSNDWLLGVGGDYSFISQKTATYTGTVSNGNIIPGQQYEVSNRYNIFVMPGYVIDKNKLMYLKAGYSNQTLKYTSPANNTGTAADPAQNLTNTVGGYVVGLGYKQMISSGFYAFGEANYMQYNKASFNSNWTSTSNTYRVQTSNFNTASSAYTFLVGVGYRF